MVLKAKSDGLSKSISELRGATVCAPLYYPAPGACIDAVAENLLGKLYA